MLGRRKFGRRFDRKQTRTLRTGEIAFALIRDHFATLLSAYVRYPREPPVFLESLIARTGG